MCAVGGCQWNFLISLASSHLVAATFGAHTQTLTHSVFFLVLFKLRIEQITFSVGVVYFYYYFARSTGRSVDSFSTFFVERQFHEFVKVWRGWPRICGPRSHAFSCPSNESGPHAIFHTINFKFAIQRRNYAFVRKLLRWRPCVLKVRWNADRLFCLPIFSLFDATKNPNRLEAKWITSFEFLEYLNFGKRLKRRMNQVSIVFFRKQRPL